MGAEFIFAALRWPHTQDQTLVPPCQDLLDEVNLRLVAVLDTIDDPAVLEGCGWFFFDDDDILTWKPQVLEATKKFTSSLFLSRDSWPHDLGLFNPPGIDGAWLLTGGETWGDSPTPSYDDLATLDVLGVTREPFAILVADTSSFD